MTSKESINFTFSQNWARILLADQSGNWHIILFRNRKYFLNIRNISDRPYAAMEAKLIFIFSTSHLWNCS